MELAKLREEIELCVYCLLCEHICTVGKHTHSMVDFPTGKCLVLWDIISGRRDFDERAIDTIYKCCQCRLCEAWCVPNAKVPDVIKAARAIVVELGKAPQYVLDIKGRIDKWGNPYGELPKPKVIKDKVDVLYFVGCATRYFHPEIIRSTTDILKILNVNFDFLDGVCCGAPLLFYGFVKDAKKMAEQTAEVINRVKCNTLLTSCPECYRMFKKEYKEWGVEVLPEVFHVTEYLAREKPAFKGEMLVKVTYHDPCALGRGMGIYEEPRRLLERIPGVKLVEMRWNREKANCCGGTLGVFPDLALEIARSRVAEAKETGAEMLLTTCPTCKRMFSLSERQIKVLDITEFIAQSIR